MRMQKIIREGRPSDSGVKLSEFKPSATQEKQSAQYLEIIRRAGWRGATLADICDQGGFIAAIRPPSDEPLVVLVERSEIRAARMRRIFLTVWMVKPKYWPNWLFRALTYEPRIAQIG